MPSKPLEESDIEDALNDDDLLLYAKADLTDSEDDSSVSEGLSAGPETKKRKRKTLGRMEKHKLNPTRAPEAKHHPKLPVQGIRSPAISG